MPNVIKTLTYRCTLACAVVLASLNCRVHAQGGSGSMAARLLEASGDNYVAARAAAVSMSKASFEPVSFELRSGGPASKGTIIAAAIAVRRSTPAVADEFDTHLSQSIQQPSTDTRSGKPKYNAWWPKDRFELDPLVLEVIVKRLAPDPLRHQFMEGLARPNPANLKPILAILDSDGLPYAGVLVDACAGKIELEDSITPAIVDLHKKWRSTGVVSSGGIFALSRIGREPQLAALLSVRDFERLRAEAQGASPWSDDNARKDYEGALMALDHSKAELESARSTGSGANSVSRAERVVENASQRASDLRTKCHIRELWVELEAQIAALESRLANDVGGGAAPSGDPLGSKPR